MYSFNVYNLVNCGNASAILIAPVSEIAFYLNNHYYFIINMNNLFV